MIVLGFISMLIQVSQTAFLPGHEDEEGDKVEKDTTDEEIFGSSDEEQEDEDDESEEEEEEKEKRRREAKRRKHEKDVSVFLIVQ